MCAASIFFFICSIFINSHMLTSPCLALLAYRFIKTLHYCLMYRRSLYLAFSYVCISCVFDGIPIQTKKKSLTI